MKRLPLFLSLSSVLLSVLLSSTPVFAAGPVLIIGDERVQGRFGELLEQKLREKDGTASSRISACGLTVLDWLQGSKTNCGYFEKKLTGEVTQSKEAQVAPLITYVSDTKPEFLIFIHGNRGLDTGVKALQAQIELVGRLLTANKTGCLWMGPGEEVSARVSDPYYSAIREAATRAGCAVIDAPLFSALLEQRRSLSELEPLAEVVVEMISVGRDL